MNAQQTIPQAILQLVEAWTSRLMALNDDVARQRISYNQWTLRQILGHMIDSASNNTHRIIHLQYQPSPFAFPDYGSLGNNDKWVDIQDYQSEKWEDLVQLWKYINRHIAHVMSRVDPEKLNNRWLTALGEEISLADMMAGYVQHLQLHLEEILEVINPRKIIVTIDGHAGSGKSTMAAELAQAVGYAYVDTGAMYRAVTLYALETGIAASGNIDAERLSLALADINMEFRLNADGASELWLNGRCVEREIRSIEVGGYVSPVAAITAVRRKLVASQQALGREKGLVMDGRDIGTVVFPQAELKVFVTAAPEIRAKRRFDELMSKGEQPSFEEVLENVKQRDHIDESRADSPLRQADDALLLDNSFMTREDQKAWMIQQFYKALRR